MYIFQGLADLATVEFLSDDDTFNVLSELLIQSNDL